MNSPKYIRVKGQLYRRAVGQRPSDPHPSLDRSPWAKDWTDDQLEKAGNLYDHIQNTLAVVANTMQQDRAAWFRGITGRDPDTYQKLPGMDRSEIFDPNHVIKKLTELEAGVRAEQGPVRAVELYLRHVFRHLDYWAEQKQQELDAEQLEAPLTPAPR